MAKKRTAAQKAAFKKMQEGLARYMAGKGKRKSSGKSKARKTRRTRRTRKSIGLGCMC